MVGLSLADTARLTAACRAREAGRTRPRHVDPFAHLFDESGLDPAVIERSADTVIARSRLVDRMLGGLTGVELVINLGCGFDMRPYQAPFAHLRFLELDRAEIVEHKEAVIRRHGLVPVAAVTRVVADTTTFSRLPSDGSPAVCLTEGLVTYLDGPSMLDLVGQLRARADLRYWLTDWVGPASTAWLNQQAEQLGGTVTHHRAVPLAAIDEAGFELVEYQPLAGELRRMGTAGTLPMPTRASEPGDSVLLFRAR